MKKLLILLVLTSTCFGQTEFKRVIKDETHKTTVELNKFTVRCSHVGYGSSELKVTLPSLDWKAIFDHDNGEGLGPCITAGRYSCGQDPMSDSEIPEKFLDESRPNEEIEVRIILTEEFHIDFENICSRHLTENVETTIRGTEFKHVRVKNIGKVDLKECLDKMN